MKVLIFEDESLTADRLIQLIHRYDKKFEICAVVESVKDGVEWFENNDTPDIIFMDIHLSDGPAFELFKQVKIDVPIIFTTAYDQYAIKAFKVNSVSYLLKPIDFEDLTESIDKFKKLYADKANDTVDYKTLFNIKDYKSRFLVKIGDQLKHISVNKIAYFIFENGCVDLMSLEGMKLPIEISLDNIEKLLDPKLFFRINRKIIVNFESIGDIHSYFNSRLKVELKPVTDDDVIVSRDRVAGFKAWLNS